MKRKDIWTWGSIEPVIDFKQSLEIIDKTHKYVDGYKVGKLSKYDLANDNPFKFDTQPDWVDFMDKAVTKLRKYGKDFYIKKSLREKDTKGVVKLKPHEIDQDHLTLKSFK